MGFDVIGWLEDKGIKYFLNGKNVSRGWVEIKCLWCDDPSWHLGINLQSALYHCWRCGSKGDIIRLIQEVENCSFKQARKIASKFKMYLQEDDVDKENIKREDYNEEKEILPKEATKEFPNLHLKFLESRGFDPAEVIRKYDLFACGNVGDWKFRIIIPIIQNGRIVNFTSRDVTGKARIKYKHCPNDKAIIPIKQCLYNIDSVRKTALIVEGPLDVWRVGDGTIAIMGTEFTPAQLKLLKEKKLEKVFVMLDSDAIDKAERLANQLTFVPTVKILELKSGDPANLSTNEVLEIRKKVFIS